ncbi:MAG TPA: DUF2934 domain-containing protein [Sphingobium sp.]|uniref:DUF2934 domain-containing protein n=1 Tax=Sphingobium sp. TaxID=1912891 RepID=UPI002ED422D8
MADDREQQIRARAYALWEADGKPHGKDLLHWDQATREVDGLIATTDPAEIQAEEAIEVIEEARAEAARRRKKK